MQRRRMDNKQILKPALALLAIAILLISLALIGEMKDNVREANTKTMDIKFHKFNVSSRYSEPTHGGKLLKISIPELNTDTVFIKSKPSRNGKQKKLSNER